eukprot:CAMPEP_0174318446 /NCGR_PEP_ID=MMETSP0810-20121108/8220_1 /TAXON_ID=73025 ORGANISM="Eutreptiella gymnastica-like, Strain CCMP1594" /NCGR_SAMPLE_ID=MMETSP0810 /ASSEMBLY_ACC=CAM_ASM_000659 /LENGTH=257 /DNA_ID=CAMNT_0015428691 /DNA_START=416 /DNA_END=1191 /DNA_ORIENTATION=-
MESDSGRNDTNCDRNLQSTSHLSQASGHNSAAHAGTQTHMMSTMGVEVELHVGQCGIKRASLPEVRFAEWLAATTNRHMLEGPGTRPLGPHFDLHPQLHPIAQHLQWAWVQIHPPSCSCALAKGMTVKDSSADPVKCPNRGGYSNPHNAVRVFVHDAWQDTTLPKSVCSNTWQQQQQQHSPRNNNNPQSFPKRMHVAEHSLLFPPSGRTAPIPPFAVSIPSSQRLRFFPLLLCGNGIRKMVPENPIQTAESPATVTV